MENLINTKPARAILSRAGFRIKTSISHPPLNQEVGCNLLLIIFTPDKGEKYNVQVADDWNYESKPYL